MFSDVFYEFFKFCKFTLIFLFWRFDFDFIDCLRLFKIRMFEISLSIEKKI